MKSVAVIGAGVTGLTAAFRLKQKGIPVTVYEASGRAGGVIQSIRKDGYLAECGPNTCLETSPKITELIADLGLTNRRCYTESNATARYLVRGGKPIEMPDSPAGFFKTPLFSARAKTNLLIEPLIRRSASDTEESVGDFVKRRLGQEFLDYAINPLVAGIYAGNPAKLSVKHAFPKLHALEQKYGSLILGQIFGARHRKHRKEVSKQDAKKFSFDEGLQVLTDELSARLSAEIKLQTPVVAIEQTLTGWKVTAKGQGSEETTEHSAVLFVAPVYALANIRFKTFSPFTTVPLTRVEYPPITSVVLGFRRADVQHSCSGFGVLIPEVDSFNVLGVIFSSALFPNRAPKDHVTLTCYVGGSRNPKLALQDNATLRGAVLGDLQRLLGVKGAPTFEHYFHYAKAIPQYNVGYGQIKQLMSDIEKAAPGFFFAGHYRDGIALSDSIVAGDNIAERLAEFVSEYGGGDAVVTNRSGLTGNSRTKVIPIRLAERSLSPLSSNFSETGNH